MSNNGNGKGLCNPMLVLFGEVTRDRLAHIFAEYAPCVIPPSGQISRQTPKNGSDFSAEELHTAIDGYIEIIHQQWFPEYLLLCDEDGHAKNLPLNLGFSVALQQTIVGPVFVCRTEQVK